MSINLIVNVLARVVSYDCAPRRSLLACSVVLHTTFLNQDTIFVQEIHERLILRKSNLPDTRISVIFYLCSLSSSLASSRPL